MSTTHGDRADLPPPHAEEVSEGVFAYIQPDGTWHINNTGFLVGRTGVTSVDACSTERRTRAYLEAIAEITHLPVRLLVNTHHHGDHTNGNYLFPGAAIVAHERCRATMLEAGLLANVGIFEETDWGALELAPPFVTFDDRLTVWLDDTPCEVRHVGTPAHTTNDSLVWLPDRSLLFSGDLLFNGGTPYVLMGSVTGAIDVLERVVRPLGADTIVPGHGPVAGPGLVDEVLGYLRFVLDAATKGIDAGLTPLETAREVDLGPYAELHNTERIVGNLHRAYAELSGTAPGGGIDVVAALNDMVAYNGGRPLTCLA